MRIIPASQGFFNLIVNLFEVAVYVNLLQAENSGLLSLEDSQYPVLCVRSPVILSEIKEMDIITDYFEGFCPVVSGPSELDIVREMCNTKHDNCY